MTPEESELYRLELTIGDAYPTQDKDLSLKELAIKVGANTVKRFDIDAAGAQLELVSNIHQALQTASMIDACKTASRNYQIAVTATKAAIWNYRIAAAIALLAMIAAYIAAFRG